MKIKQEILMRSLDGYIVESNALSDNELASIASKALDDVYHYGAGTPGNTFGWKSSIKSAQYGKAAINAGKNIEQISSAIHDGWNETAKEFVKNPEQFDDTAKLKADGKLEAKLAQREKLMKLNYSSLPEEEKEKDRVVARALYKAITGKVLK